MLQRAFRLLLAAVLFWSALATQEHPLQLADARATAEMVAGNIGEQGGGSVDQHHLDDLPGQHSPDPANDLPVWFPATTIGLGLDGLGQARDTTLTFAMATTAWDVPPRPPCA